MKPQEPPSIIRLVRESGERAIAEPLNLGKRVRALRKARGMTLEQAARAAGLARSTLSKIENGQMSPTYDAMKKLVRGLEISLPQLFTPPSTPGGARRMAVTKRGGGAAHPTATYEHEILAEAIADKRMLPYRARVRARGLEEFDGWVRHDGEEFLYVLAGRVRLYSEFHAPVEMRRGDSAYYDASMGHNLISVSQDDAEVLWVTTLV